MVTAELEYRISTDKELCGNEYAEVFFYGGNDACKMLSRLATLVSRIKLEKQLMKIECYKEKKQKNLKLIERTKLEINSLNKTETIFNREVRKQYKEIATILKQLKKENALIDKKIEQLDANKYYKASELLTIQKELLQEMGFAIVKNTYVPNIESSVDHYKCTLSDEEVYNKAKETFLNLEAQLEMDLEKIRRAFKYSELDLTK